MTRRVIVIGAGVIGLAVAWTLAEGGTTVTVVSDPAAPAASNAAVGGLSFCLTDAVLAGDSSVIDLSIAARAGFETFVHAVERRSGVSTRFRRQATLLTRIAEEDCAVLDRVETARAMLGLASIRLNRAECLDREPTLSKRVHEGLLLEEHSQIDSAAFTTALRTACLNAGVTFVSGSVRGLTIEEERATGVRLENGKRLQSDQVVIAAGAWSGRFDDGPAELVGCVRPIAGQILVVEAPANLPVPAHDLRTDRVYIVSRSDRTLLIGATTHDRGFDGTSTVGDVSLLLTEAEVLWPPLASCQWQRTVVGMRPKSADGLPLVGATSIAGAFAATGHYKNGIMFAAETAHALAAILSGEPAPSSFTAFSPLRLAVA